MRFVPEDLDFALSPLTGLTRRHWVKSAEWLLEGVFAHLKGPDAPLVFPQRSAVTYPRPGAPWYVLRAEEFEGLARTFLIAAPLVEELPGLTLRGVGVRDYYARAILRACDPQSPQFVGWPQEIARENGGNPAQQLVEMAGLCVGLMSARRSIWERYSATERAVVLACLQSYATAKTHPHNWRFFNVLIGAFLQRNGVAVDEAEIDAHLDALMAYYAGDGWYRDGIEFDYYSAWAFQFYGPLWCEWIGYRTRPELAALIERRHGELMANYPWFFGRSGESLLWGRSAAYRCAASTPLVTAFTLRSTPLDPGWARRISSGNLMQFIGREDFRVDEIPSLGFYGPSEAVVQGYSCAASPFWLGKIFQALSLPADSPFWTAVENEGVWPQLRGESRTIALPGPGLTATLHGATGAAECRSGKVTQAHAWYQRLAFNTAFPWEADDADGGVEMSYVLRRSGQLSGETRFSTPSDMRHAGMREGVLYRQIQFHDQSPLAWAVIDLAEMILPDGGVLRVDRARLGGACEIHLGHFGLPHLDQKVPVLAADDASERRTLTARMGGRAVSMTTYRGWDRLECRVHEGKNVEAAVSSVVHAVRRVESATGGVVWLVTLLRHRTDDGAWTAEEMDPMAELRPHGTPPSGLTVRFKNGEERCVEFAGMEGRLET